MSYSVYFILPPQVTLLDLAGPLETLRVSKTFGADIEINIASPSKIISTSTPINICGLKGLPKKLNKKSLVIVPGVLDEKVSYKSKESLKIIDFLKTITTNNETEVMSICTGAFLLGKAGLLDSRECTTHHQYTDKLKEEFPKALVLENRVITDDSNLYCSAGIAAGIDLLLYWLNKKFGHTITLKTAHHLNIYFRRTLEDPTISPWLAGRNHIHRTVHMVQDIISNDPTSSHSIKELAKQVYASSRHLSRVFKQCTGMTIHQYHLSIKHALFNQWQGLGYNQEKSAIASGFTSVQSWRKSKILIAKKHNRLK